MRNEFTISLALIALAGPASLPLATADEAATQLCEQYAESDGVDAYDKAEYMNECVAAETSENEFVEPFTVDEPQQEEPELTEYDFKPAY